MYVLHRSVPVLALALTVACGQSSHGPGQGATTGGSGGQSSAAGAGTSAAGGSTADSRLSMGGVLARKQGDCVIEPSDDETVNLNGTLDRLLASSYTAPLLLWNSYAERLTLNSVEVSVYDTALAPLVERFTVPVTGIVDADETGAVMATLLPSGVVGELPDDTVFVDVVVLGNTASGSPIRSRNLRHPVELCSGCLISYPAEARDTPAGQAYLCKTGSDAAALMLEGDYACESGIDLPTPCTLCSDQVEACRDPMLNPSAAP